MDTSNVSDAIALDPDVIVHIAEHQKARDKVIAAQDDLLVCEINLRQSIARSEGRLAFYKETVSRFLSQSNGSRFT